MKLFKLNILTKPFGNKIISITNSLKAKNPRKEKKETPISKILKFEKLAIKNENEIENEELKNIHKAFIDDVSKKMSINYFKVYDSTNEEKNLEKIQNFCSKTLTPKELNCFIIELQNCKNKLSNDSSQINEAFIKVFLDKMTNLTPSIDINKSLISLISEINLNKLNFNLLFGNKQVIDKSNQEFLEEFGSDKTSKTQNTNLKKPKKLDIKKQDNPILKYYNYNPDSVVNEDMESYIQYNTISKNFYNFLNLNDPKLTDIAISTETYPEESFKDSFILNHSYKFSKPLLIQNNFNQTKFDRSNYIYFTNMPCLFPILEQTSKGEQNILLKHITNEILLLNNMKISDENILEFNKEFLFNSLDNNYFNPEIEISKLYSRVTEKSKKYSENLDFSMAKKAKSNLDNFLSNELIYDPSFTTKLKENKKIRGKKSASVDGVKINNYFAELKKLELDQEIMNSVIKSYFSQGFLNFNSYEEKLNFIQSTSYIFGVHIQKQRIEFQDADFCHFLSVKLRQNYKEILVDSNNDNYLNNEDDDNDTMGNNMVELLKEIKKFDSISLDKLMNYINLNLIKKRFNGEILAKPKYNNYSMEFDELSPNEKITIRFNSFSECYEALRILENDSILECNILKPEVNFYNEYFISGLDLVLQNSIQDFDVLMNIKANYSV